MVYLFCNCWVVRLRSLIGLSQVKQGTHSPRKIAWVYYTLANVFTMDLGYGMQQCEFKVKHCILVPFLCSLVWGGWLESCDRTTRKRWCEITKWFLFSEQKILYISLSNHNAKSVIFFCPNRPAKTNLGPTPTVQIEKTARCPSLGRHCMKNILSCEDDCSPMSRLNLGKYRLPKNPSTNANVSLYHVARATCFFNLIAVLLLVNRQSAFAKQRPSWARSDDHTGSIVPCLRKTCWVCGLQGSSFDANTKLHKMFDILFLQKRKIHAPSNHHVVYTQSCTLYPCIHLQVWN